MEPKTRLVLYCDDLKTILNVVVKGISDHIKTILRSFYKLDVFVSTNVQKTGLI